MDNRSQLILDIEHDLNVIKNRLNAIEDHFEDDGLIARLAETAHLLAIKLEALEAKIDAREQ